MNVRWLSPYYKISFRTWELLMYIEKPTMDISTITEKQKQKKN